LFPEIFDRPVVAKFDQVQGSSDGGAILLKAADRRLGLTEALAACLDDERQPGKLHHQMQELLTQRVMAIACGYEDANDAARLLATRCTNSWSVGSPDDSNGRKCQCETAREVSASQGASPGEGHPLGSIRRASFSSTHYSQEPRGACAATGAPL
jgi:hypothetical protein